MQDPTPQPGRPSWQSSDATEVASLDRSEPSSTSTQQPGISEPHTSGPRSFRERFWTVQAANVEIDKDRERKRAEKRKQEDKKMTAAESEGSFEPKHAASEPLTTTTTSAHGADQTAPSATGVGRSEDEGAPLPRSDGKDAASQRPSNRFARRIVDYIKPPREDE